MNKQKNEVLEEISDDEILKKVSGSYSPGPSMVWGAIMSSIFNGRYSCSWPGDFYSPAKPGNNAGFGHSGICTSR